MGTGTLVPDDKRRSPAHLVEGRGFRILLDCGAGSLHGFARFGRSWEDLTHVALTHFHTDHVGDLAALLFALRHGPDPPRRRPLTLLGPPGTRSFHRRLARAHGDHVLEPGFPVRVVELPRSGEWTDPETELVIRTAPTPHTERSVAYRLETGSGVVGYSGDTGPSRALGDFFVGTDLLLLECSLPDPPPMDTHLTPRGVATLADRARPGLLVTTHHYPPLDPGEIPDLVAAAGYTGEVRGGTDGLTLIVGGGGVEIPDQGGAPRDR